MRVSWTRRAVISSALWGLAGAALADAPLTSLRPRSRPATGGQATEAPAASGLDSILADTGLDGDIGMLVVDARSGRVIDSLGATAAMSPASVAKTVTALYGLETLGAGHRFVTRVIGTGPLTADGVLQGDLVLAGGGDPGLDTDALAGLAATLAAAGLRGVSGRFLVWDGALPRVTEIDPAQLPHLAYNPALSGLNLNYNRVHFEWAQTGAGYAVSLDARTERFRPVVAMARMSVVDRALPVYTYDQQGGIDDWTVARQALGEGGSRWLPVRAPGVYAGDVFRTLALSYGISLPQAQTAASLAGGTELARTESPALIDLVRDMLVHSTNLTAEVIGLTATQARGLRPAGLAASAGAMSDWARDRTNGAAQMRLTDHSGLSDRSRMRAADMVAMLTAAGAEALLRPLLKTIPILDAEGAPIPGHPSTVVAKTGTLNFVSSLAGYQRSAAGTELAFAIFAANPARREQAIASGEEVPQGARSWNGKARLMQQALLRRWAGL